MDFNKYELRKNIRIPFNVNNCLVTWWSIITVFLLENKPQSFI